jgi:outer membrane protein OmpA-like peptidoglycan-associated protein
MKIIKIKIIQFPINPFFVKIVLTLNEHLKSIRKKFLMKHTILQLALLLSWFSTFSQEIPTPDNNIFVTNEISINSDQLEFSPTFLEDGILFISTNPVNNKFKVQDKRIGQNIMSIYRSIRNDEGKLQAPEPFAIELVSTVHEGPLTFDRTAENMFFTRNNIDGKKRIKGTDGVVKLQIYSAQRMDNVWKNVEKLPFNDRNSNAAHPSISVENNELYFSSDRPDGQGGMDLYVSIKSGNTWGEPINLGPKVNTQGDEVFPFIHADGTLYFSSKGAGEETNLDLFTVNKVNGEWDIPENMGAPFNSKKDDFGIIIDRDKRNGYFSSDRSGGIGGDDIYSFYALNGLKKNVETVPDIEKEITINIKDNATGAIIEQAIVTYMKLDELTLGKAITGISTSNGEEKDPNDLVLKLPIDENAKTGLTDSNGQLILRLNRGNYVVKVEKKGMQSKQIALNSQRDILEYTVLLSGYSPTLANNSDGNNSDGNSNGNEAKNKATSGSESDYEDKTDSGSETNSGSETDSGSKTDYENEESLIDNGVITTIEEGTIIELPNIYYNFNDASIRPDAQADLNSLADFLINYPATEIELISHTDSRGNDRYNNRLSQRRAENAVDFLIKKGINRNRLVPNGYGESQLRNHCNDFSTCSEEDHQYNRRTEVKITKMDAPITISFINNLPSYISEAPASTKSKEPNKTHISPSDPSSTVIDLNVEKDEYDPEGNYKVIAGVFANINNAEKRLVEIRALGFNNADILKLGGSVLFHVVVSRYRTSESAKRIVGILKSQNVKAFVKG